MLTCLTLMIQRLVSGQQHHSHIEESADTLSHSNQDMNLITVDCVEVCILQTPRQLSSTFIEGEDADMPVIDDSEVAFRSTAT